MDVEERREYYHTHYPHKLMYDWLSYGKKDEFPLREFSFTVGDSYIRYQSFKDCEGLKNRIQSFNPDKIDIGSFFNVVPNIKKKSDSDFFATKKEFVIDIDITDYDNVRLCGCREAKYCQLCWPLMSCAIEILNYLLEELFGCEKLLWIYSGRRGIHCWVCDEKFMDMDTMGRSAVADFLHIYCGTKEDIRKLNFEGKIHPQFGKMSKVFKIAEKYFLKSICEDMELFEGKNVDLLLEVIGDSKLAKDVVEKLEDKIDYDPDEKWKELTKMFQKNSKYSSLELEIIYSFVYPRLDANVSKHLNHLLKAPFCIHPKTGYVCTPIHSDMYLTFYPDEHSPELSGLISKDEKALGDFKKSVDTFEEFVGDLLGGDEDKMEK